jgi:hypothetical protein
MGEIPFTKRISPLLSLALSSCTSFGLSLAFPFVFCVMILAIDFYRIFCFGWSYGSLGLKEVDHMVHEVIWAR